MMSREICSSNNLHFKISSNYNKNKCFFKFTLEQYQNGSSLKVYSALTSFKCSSIYKFFPSTITKCPVLILKIPVNILKFYKLRTASKNFLKTFVESGCVVSTKQPESFRDSGLMICKVAQRRSTRHLRALPYLFPSSPFTRI